MKHGVKLVSIEEGVEGMDIDTEEKYEKIQGLEAK